MLEKQLAIASTINAAGLKSVVHFEVLFFGVDDEVIVDSDLAEFIDDDGVAPAVDLREDTVKQRSLWPRDSW